MKRLSLAIPLAALAWPCLVEAAPPLATFTVDFKETSVSGLSSGAYMAGQFHVAFSASLKGAAIIAGGPYGCAQGQLPLALNQCMQAKLGAPKINAILAAAGHNLRLVLRRLALLFAWIRATVVHFLGVTAG